MKVTIITSCFNRVDTIRATIESVLSQTWTDLEYIVVDGGSTDGSREIIDKYRDRIDKVIFKADHGMYEGINNGIREATGDIIALCHSDDVLYDRHTVEAVVRVFEQQPQTEMVYADGIFVNDKTGKASRIWKGGNVNRWRLACGWLPLHTTCYVRKEVYERYGCYDESYRIAADTKFLLNIIYRQHIASTYLPRYVVKMRMGGVSTDRNKRNAMWQEDIRVFHETGFRFPTVMKIMKMTWKPTQFVKAWFQNI